MKKVLDYFWIEGAYGGNQDWFTNIVMHIGGCAAAAACDTCIYFAKKFGMKELYPFDIDHLTKADYKKFSQIMKPYIRPRMTGVKKIEWYMDEFANYIEAVNAKYNVNYDIGMEGLSGYSSWGTAKNAIKDQIDAGYPVPYLMLQHLNKDKFGDFIWHWFLVVGYELCKDDLTLIVANYGQETKMSLKELWDTGCPEKGGIVLYR